MFNPASRYAMLGAAAVLSASNGVCSSASVAVGGLTPKATKANAVGNALVGQPLNADTIAAAAEMVSNDLGADILNDIHASADYRREMAPVYVRRALTKAAERA
jgi:carbon-monoxide dehydrogenase medium subunit